MQVVLIDNHFPIQMWNQHHEVTQGIQRKINAVEAWHRSLNATVGCYHPNIWRFIDALKREQGLVEVKQAKFIAGDKPTKRRKAYANEEGLKNLIQSYFHRQPIEFLQGVAHRIEMNDTYLSIPLYIILHIITQYFIN